MIAYNHVIQFIPELANDKEKENKKINLDVIIVKKSENFTLKQTLVHKFDYINNQGRDLKLHTDRQFSRTQKGQIWAFEIKGVLTFFWESGTLTLSYLEDEKFTKELLAYWCLHIVLPMFFTIEEKYNFLHAGAVEVENKPVLFIAESYGGKSTMTNFFMEKGHTLISDDKVAVVEEEGEFFAISSHPHHRPYRKMEDLGFYVNNFSTNPKAIEIIYKLERVEKNGRISIIQLQGAEKFISLRYASEMNLIFQKRQRFEYLIKLAKKVLVFKITVPHDLAKLEEVYNMICKHTKGQS